MQPTTPTTGTATNTKSFDQQLADIKSQARTIVTQAQKISPDIKIKPVDAEMIGLKANIPTTKQTTPRPSALDTVGTTPLPQTGLDKAREAILGSVKNQEDRDIIDQILQVSTGLQTERGTQLEGTADSILTQQLANIKSTRDRALDTSTQKEAMKLPELEAELESIRSENDVLTARKNAAIQAAEREQGMSTAAKAGNVQRISRDFDLEQANLAIRELASVGKINASTKLIQAKMDLKYGDLEAEANLLTAQINAIKPFLDREDAKAADMRLQLNEVVKGKLADARAEDTALEEFKLQSYINAQQNGASPAVLSSIMSSDNRQDVASVGGTFIQSPMEKLQMEQLRTSIQTNRLEQQQIQAEINASLPEKPVSYEEYVNQSGYGNQSRTPELEAKLQTEYAKYKQTKTVASKLSPLANAVMSNPATYEGLTATDKGKILPELVAAGFKIPRKLGAEQEKAANMADSGISALQQIEGQILQDDGTFNVGWWQATNPFSAFANNRRTLIDSISRISSGAALTEQEQDFYVQQTPTSFDSDETIRQKRMNLAVFLSGISGNTVTLKSPNGEVYAFDDMFDPRVRADVREAVKNGYQLASY